MNARRRAVGSNWFVIQKRRTPVFATDLLYPWTATRMTVFHHYGKRSEYPVRVHSFRTHREAVEHVLNVLGTHIEHGTVDARTVSTGRVTESGLMVWLQPGESVIPATDNDEQGKASSEEQA